MSDFKDIQNIKEFNIELIKNNFNTTDIEKEQLRNSLKCGEDICGKYNQKIIDRENNFIYCYLPLPYPNLTNNEKVSHFFICKEPSTGWAKGKQEIAIDKVKNNENINFIERKIKLSKLQILFIAFFQVFKDKFYITDLSKCAINRSDVIKLKLENLKRYECCESLIKYEINKFANENTTFCLIGDNHNESRLRAEIGNRKIINLPHYAIRIPCPDYVNKMVSYYANDLKLEAVKEEIKKGFDNLTSNLKNNFILNFDLTTVEIKKISDTNVMLYLIYKSCFEESKTI